MQETGNESIAKQIGRSTRATAVQVAVVLGLITLAVVAGITSVGLNTNTKLNQTATDVGNPASLVTRFGS